MSLHSICVYCGSNRGSDPLYAHAAEALGAALVERGIALVYGGGNVGLMGILADAVMAAGGTVTGVIPQALLEKEVGHRRITQLEVVQTMHERKARMSELSDAFIALPGAFGTLDETFEALTWTQLGYHAKACGLLNVGGYFDGLLAFLDRAVRDGFLKPANRDLLLAETDIGRLLERLAAHAPTHQDKWIHQAGFPI